LPLISSTSLKRSLNQIHLLLQNTSYSNSCCICLSHPLSTFSAFPVPPSIVSTQLLTLSSSKLKGTIFSEQADTLLGSYPTAQADQTWCFPPTTTISTSSALPFLPLLDHNPTHPLSCSGPILLL
jgi:hypothetical protein